MYRWLEALERRWLGFIVKEFFVDGTVEFHAFLLDGSGLQWCRE